MKRAMTTCAAVAIASFIAMGTARAQQPEDKKSLEDVEPPQPLQDAARDVKASAAAEPAGKAGPFLIEAGAGPSFNLDSSDLSLAVALNLGFAIVKGDGDGIGGGDLYIVIGPSLAFGEYVELAVPAGLQYDVPLPVADLYVYPRATAGYAAVLNPGEGESGDGLAITPAVGVKMQATPAFHISLEPFNLPIIVGNGGSVLEYRALAYLGFDL